MKKFLTGALIFLLVFSIGILFVLTCTDLIFADGNNPDLICAVAILYNASIFAFFKYIEFSKNSTEKK